VSKYSPRPSKTRDAKSRQYFYQYTARLKRELLESLAPERLSPETRAHIAEERRRFGTAKRGATFSGPTWVGSSMSADEIGKADDDDVVNAFRELPVATGWDNPKTWQKGGNIQLSRAFAEFAKANHSRAVEIISRLDREIGARGAGYTLEAMAEDADPKLITGLILDLEARGFAGEEFHGSTARAIERLIKRDIEINDAILTIMMGWLSQANAATEPTPAKTATDSEEDLVDETFADTDTDEEKERQGSILWGMGGLTILPVGSKNWSEVEFPVLA
jgi:hypothetical protein